MSINFVVLGFKILITSSAILPPPTQGSRKELIRLFIANVLNNCFTALGSVA